MFQHQVKPEIYDMLFNVCFNIQLKYDVLFHIPDYNCLKKLICIKGKVENAIQHVWYVLGNSHYGI